MTEDHGKDRLEPETGESDPTGKEAAIGRLALELARQKPSGPTERIYAARRLADVGVTDPVEVAALMRCGEWTAREALAAIDVRPGKSAARKPSKRTMEAWARRLAALDTLIGSADLQVLALQGDVTEDTAKRDLTALRKLAGDAIDSLTGHVA